MKLVENTVVAGRFRLNRLLGRGGMGSVWHATHLGLDVPCAVKFIEGSNALSPDAQARFEREAKAAAQLRSPHVVQIFDHGVCDGTPYIAMELLEGEDLGKRLTRFQRIPASALCPIVTQVCRALTRAHPLGIVHRDLKPDNIFLVHDDEREIAKVLDFGIAKADSQGLGGSNTRTGALLGTPHYMSPEQAQGTRQVDFRSDLWSLAVICFRALTGQLPFRSEALGDLLVKIIVAPIPVPSECGPVPEGFDAWWFKAAQRDPNGRFQTAKDFADSLSAACGISHKGSAEVLAAPVTSNTQPLPTLKTTPAYGPATAAPITFQSDLIPGPSRVLVATVGAALAVVVVGVGGFALWKTVGTSHSGERPTAPLAPPVSAEPTTSADDRGPPLPEVSAEPPPSAPPPVAEEPAHEPPVPVAKPTTIAHDPHTSVSRGSAPPKASTTAKSKPPRDMGF